ncbi:MAG: DUF4249 family protein [Candidatus Marinimicrobia bacterium]|nr:DUF4249 family protein [Candidatus Neomarinimicrobiota bacterium]
MKKIFVLIFIALISCDLPQDPGPMPTEIIQSEYIPGLNIFGVLRNDGIPGTSFFRVERSWETEEATMEFVVTVENATITIASDSSAWDFTFTIDSLHGEIYANPDFSPDKQVQYQLIANAPGLPELTGEVTVPAIPMVDTSSILIENNVFQVSIAGQAEIEMYDIVVISDYNSITQRYLSNGDTLIAEVNLSNLIGEPVGLAIYAYETNLTQYQTSTMTIKPQTYHEAVNTVMGGYGCFGAVSVFTLPIN